MISETEIDKSFDEIANSLVDFMRIKWIDGRIKRDVIRSIADRLYPDRPELKMIPKPACVEICCRLESIDESLETLTGPIVEAYYAALNYM